VRHRLGVVVLLPQPLAAEVNGIRRALGDADRETIPPHITLVPPVNVHDRDLLRALDVLRDGAAAVAPFTVRIGPATTFHPVTPTVYLDVRGDIAALTALRDGVFVGPLHRELDHPFVPHVTLDADHPPDRIAAAVASLSSFDVELTVDRVVALRRGDDRAWVPFAEAPLARPATVGRGGLPLDIAVTGRLDPEAAALLAVDGAAGGEPFAVTARRDGRVIGAAWGWTGPPILEIADLAVAELARNQGVGRHLLAAVVDVATRRDCTTLGVTAPNEGASAALLRGSGWNTTGDLPGDLRRWTRSL
jgi:2'-5' RNA ligase